MKRLAWIVPVMLAGASALAVVDGDRTLKLEPPPKELHLYEGGFRLNQKTKIYVQFGHQSEDRIAAETLAEEISDQSGLKLEIVAMKATGRAEDGAIVLSRLEDKWVRRFLARNGLQADESVGENGYLLFSDDHHLIVAANSGQGLFYGVQTLRQLLRPSPKGMICPAVGIRDWPSPITFSVQDEGKRGIPQKVVKHENRGVRSAASAGSPVRTGLGLAYGAEVRLLPFFPGTKRRPVFSGVSLHPAEVRR